MIEWLDGFDLKDFHPGRNFGIIKHNLKKNQKNLITNKFVKSQVNCDIGMLTHISQVNS